MSVISTPASHAGTRRWMSTLARLVLAGVWAAAGLTKVGNPASTVRAVRAYQILPESAVHTVGYALPFVEFALALLLLLGIANRAAAAASTVLLLLFIAAVASAGLRGLNIDCGCFGGGGAVAPGATRYLSEIARDSLFVGIASWLMVFPRSSLALDAGTDDDPAEDLADPAGDGADHMRSDGVGASRVRAAGSAASTVNAHPADRMDD